MNLIYHPHPLNRNFTQTPFCYLWKPSPPASSPKTDQGGQSFRGLRVFFHLLIFYVPRCHKNVNNLTSLLASTVYSVAYGDYLYRFLSNDSVARLLKADKYQAHSQIRQDTMPPSTNFQTYSFTGTKNIQPTNSIIYKYTSRGHHAILHFDFLSYIRNSITIRVSEHHTKWC
jgi:hypothetical protein